MHTEFSSMGLQDVCPQQTDIPSALVRCATLVATDAEGKAPVDTGAQHTPVHSGNDAESSFITLGTAGANTEGTTPSHAFLS